jgi:hypothetical protein
MQSGRIFIYLEKIFAFYPENGGQHASPKRLKYIVTCLVTSDTNLSRVRFSVTSS